jgi:TetR/AcrR family transcriptional regulator, transcriptional repressor for nem operon
MNKEVLVENTRMRILEAAQEEIYEQGFQGMRIDAILQKTQLAKGALYHYFPSKLALGYAVVDEVILSKFTESWKGFHQELEDPITVMQTLLLYKAEKFAELKVFNGCPCNNLVQEMAAIDEGFRERLQKIMDTIIVYLCEALTIGQVKGYVRKDINVEATALFVFSCYQGIISTAKCTQSIETLVQLIKILNTYMDTLRVPSI